MGQYWMNDFREFFFLMSGVEALWNLTVWIAIPQLEIREVALVGMATAVFFFRVREVWLDDDGNVVQTEQATRSAVNIVGFLLASCAKSPRELCKFALVCNMGTMAILISKISLEM